jgi:hypothetical protein
VSAIYRARRHFIGNRTVKESTCSAGSARVSASDKRPVLRQDSLMRRAMRTIALAPLLLVISVLHRVTRILRLRWAQSWLDQRTEHFVNWSLSGTHNFDGTAPGDS